VVVVVVVVSSSSSSLSSSSSMYQLPCYLFIVVLEGGEGGRRESFEDPHVGQAHTMEMRGMMEG